MLPTDPSKSITFDYPETTIKIPIPNVKLQKTALTMSGKSGRLMINNTGKKAARLAFETTSAGFTVQGGEQEIEPSGSFELQVVYTGTDAATGEVTVKSNDPDSPVLTFKVGANGAPVGDPDLDDDGASSGGKGAAGLGDTVEEGGCGCRATGGAGETAGYGALLGSLVAAAAFLRRRAR